MNFRTTSTIEEQMSHVKKYAPLLLLNIPRKYQYLLYSIPFIAIFADFVFNWLNRYIGDSLIYSTLIMSI